MMMGYAARGATLLCQRQPPQVHEGDASGSDLHFINNNGLNGRINGLSDDRGQEEENMLKGLHTIIALCDAIALFLSFNLLRLISQLRDMISGDDLWRC
jgi:hypothetical protein